MSDLKKRKNHFIFELDEVCTKDDDDRDEWNSFSKTPKVGEKFGHYSFNTDKDE